jgi:hypothetical protein
VQTAGALTVGQVEGDVGVDRVFWHDGSLAAPALIASARCELVVELAVVVEAGAMDDRPRGQQPLLA